MGYSLAGAIESIEVFDNGNEMADCFCLLPHLGNDSILIRELADCGELLPERLSWPTIDELTILVENDLPQYRSNPMISREKAQELVSIPLARWAEIGESGSLSISDNETNHISYYLHSARSLNLAGLEQLQERYKQNNPDDSGQVVTVKAGEPLPERVIGFAGSDADGTQLYVESEDGIASYWLNRIIELMRTATEHFAAAETLTGANLKEPRFIYWLS